MFLFDLKILVYNNENPLDNKFRELPGITIEKLLKNDHFKPENKSYLIHKLTASCRKICLMWKAGNEALAEEEDFCSSTLKDAPALFGDDAINVYYHLEALILFARATLDIASGLFSCFIFEEKSYDSFNKFTKQLIRTFPNDEISQEYSRLRNEDISWFSIICGTEKGRSLRDKIVHQTEFPIEYIEISDKSEKEYAHVRIGDNYFLLSKFIDEFRYNIASNYIKLEKFCQLIIKK